MTWTTRTADGLRNVHERTVATGMAHAAELLCAVGSSGDRIWPGERWDPMILSDGHRVGSHGGHGEIRYRVVCAEPDRFVWFAFTVTWLRGWHELSIEPDGEGVRWRHASWSCSSPRGSCGR